MILYHFTYPKYLEAILREGVRPADGKASGNDPLMFGGRNAVWLTAKPTLVPSRRVREYMLRTCLGWMSNNSSALPLATCRLQVRLPTHDRSLKPAGAWLRKRYPSLSDDMLMMYENHWLYFGVVKPTAIMEHVQVPEGDPNWSLPPDMVAAHKAGAKVDIDEATLAYFLDGAGAAAKKAAA